MKQFLTTAFFMFLLAVAACSSTGDPEHEFLSTSSVPVGEQQPAATTQQAGPSTPSEPVVVTVPTGIPELPEVLWPTMKDPSPAAEDALKDYLIHHRHEPGWSLGWRIVVGCAGIEASPNVMCSRDPRVSYEGDRQVYTYTIGPPPPQATFYSIGIQGSVSEGWWILWANAIAR